MRRDEEGLGVAFARVGREGEAGAERLFGGEDFVEGVFVRGEFVDELQDYGDICFGEEEN